MNRIDLFLSRLAKFRTVRSLGLTGVRQVEPSLLCSADDDVSCNQTLISAALNAIADAQATNLQTLASSRRALKDAKYYDVFPGEHYRLLHSLCRTLRPVYVIEIGTFTGMSSAAILGGLPESGGLTTFDVIAWDKFESHLAPENFQTGRINQELADLSEPRTFDRYIGLFTKASLIFCDAPKDGIFEYKFLANLATVRPLTPCLLVLDDIRLLPMIAVWRSIASPKLDLTSFGHWSGTGLVDISEGLKLNNSQQDL